MDFITEHGRINCVRKDIHHNVEVQQYYEIVSFDEVVSSIPPHVAILLSREEHMHLELWLKERELLKRKLENDSMAQTILDALSAFLQEAICALDNEPVLDEIQYREINYYLMEFDKKMNKLSNVKDKNSNENLEISKLNQSEILKAQLRKIEKSITHALLNKVT